MKECEKECEMVKLGIAYNVHLLESPILPRDKTKRGTTICESDYCPFGEQGPSIDCGESGTVYVCSRDESVFDN